MYTFINFDQLSYRHLAQYRKAVSLAFPRIIQQSDIVKHYWARVETAFPQFQRVMINNDDDEVMGFICTLPFYFDKLLSELPDDGWDWLMQKGLDDFENRITPNMLGGLQIVISSKFRGKGWSKIFIQEGKKIAQRHNLSRFVLPIRPTQKHKYPKMSMEDYINLQQNHIVYDPWIRTHLNSGASIIKVCSNAMNLKGDIPFWESLLDHEITSSGEYVVDGALNPVSIDLEHNHGEYIEDNIWIVYT